MTRILRFAWSVCVLLLASVPLRAQALVPGASPRIEKVSFAGLHGVDEGLLSESIVTQPTRCKALLLKPFCWVSDAGAFKEKHYLDRAEVTQDELRIRVFLWRRGYRQAAVASSIDPTADGVAVVFRVDQGPATTVRSLALRQTEPVLPERIVTRSDLPEEGTPLDVIQLDTATSRLESALADRGYIDARVRDTVVVAAAPPYAEIEVVIEPGRKNTVGEVVIRGNDKVSDGTIRRALGLNSGEVFRPREMSRAQRQLYGSGMFRQVLVETEPQSDTVERVVFSVQEAPFRAVQTGFGFNTVDFFQVQARYTRYNWLGGGRRLDLNGTLGNLLAPQLNGTFPFADLKPAVLSGTDEGAFTRPTWQATAEVTQPAFGSPDNAVGLGVFTHRRVVPAVVVDKGYGANVSFTRRLAERTPLSLTYRYELNTVLAGGVYFCVNYGVCDRGTIDALQGQQSLSPLALSGFADRTDQPLAPTSGYRLRLDAEHASRLTLSDFRYNRASGAVIRYQRLGPGTLAARVRAGWVRPLGSTAGAVGVPDSLSGDGILHPSKRFYAGGSQSVRGYGENQLGPRILTIDPSKLLAPSDTARGAACTLASLRNGSCNPNVARSSEFDPRPLGGTELLEGNVEYRFPLFGNLGAAVFVDGATLNDRGISADALSRSAVTPGFGVRYKSPVGPIRIDLGVKPTLAETLPVVTQVTDTISGTPVNRLVRLQSLKEYNPTEGSGFLSKIFNRLTLHLSIGEAF